MTEAAANAGLAPASDSVQPSNDLNDPANLNFADPDEDNESQEQPGIDPNGETDEAQPDEAGQEADDSEQAPEADDAKDDAEVIPAASEVSVPEDALVTLENGEKVRFGDLRKSPMFEKDYRHKTQELGNQRRALEERSNRTVQVIENLSNFLTELLPQEPSTHLALTDPGEYTRQKAVYDAAVSRVSSLMQVKDTAKAVVKELTEEQRATAVREANAFLEARLPQIRDPKAREAWGKQNWDTALHFQFTPEELRANTDPRLLWMGHYAALGLKAEKAAQTAKAKLAAAPVATPAKKAAASKGDPQFLQNKEAMRKLTKSGSIHDAMKVNF